MRRIFTPSSLSLQVHRADNLRVDRRGKEAWLLVDGLINVTGQAVGIIAQLDVAPILYIGTTFSKLQPIHQIKKKKKTTTRMIHLFFQTDINQQISKYYHTLKCKWISRLFP